MVKPDQSIWTSGGEIVLETGVSGAFWCDPSEPGFVRVPKRDGKGQLCWLDALLNGGIRIPPRHGKPRALTMLVTGPPGTGKSTLATELCYRWAQRWPDFRADYITTEADEPWFVDNACHVFGDGAREQFGLDRRVRVRAVNAEALSHGGEDGGLIRWLLDTLWISKDVKGRSGAGAEDAQVVVIDSLNLIPDDTSIRDVFQKQVSELISSGPKIVIFILDSPVGQQSQASKFWAYYCDLIVKLDRTYPTTPDNQYMLRTIEVVKARYQAHAWGPHQLKIYAQDPEIKVGVNGAGSSLAVQTPADARERMVRAHPFLSDGGIFIYPSVHYVLSQYKRAHPATVKWDVPPIKGLQDILGGETGGGFPRERCTALLGARGGHKSHVGFMHILDRVLNHQECGLVVSLRDDIDISKSAMLGIIRSWAPSGDFLPKWGIGGKVDHSIFDRLPLLKQLEIMYFPPGNITPEEFLHRIRMSVLRMKSMGRPLTLLFNSLDQLGPRFPLCSREPVFIAALLQMLSGEGVTSIFVAATEQADGTGYHGLESIAELILDFRLEDVSEHNRSRIEHAYERYVPDIKQHQEVLKSVARRPNVVVLRVVRHAGGQAAGSQGILDLVDNRHPLQNFVDRGLHCFTID